MFRNNIPSWVPIFSCFFLSAVGLVISSCLILSLIPLYINNRSVEKSRTTSSVYTLSQLSFTIGSNTAKQIRITRDTNSSYLLPSGNMATSIQEQINILVSEINAAVVVSEATMSSTSTLSLTLKLYFVRGCFACRAREEKLIENIFKKDLSINVYTEYYTNCVLDPTTVGTTQITLDDGISSSNGISSPIETSIDSLVQQTDPCPNRTALVYPTDCNATEASGIVTATSVSNGTFQYYCYYFVTPASASNIKLQFDFSSSYNEVGALLDNVTLNSTENLITNGGFEIYNRTTTGYQWPPWTYSECHEYCEVFPFIEPEISDSISFLASGTGIKLSQTVAIDTVGREFVYSLGFWFQCFVTDYDSTESCPLIVTLVTT